MAPSVPRAPDTDASSSLTAAWIASDVRVCMRCATAQWCDTARVNRWARATHVHFVRKSDQGCKLLRFADEPAFRASATARAPRTIKVVACDATVINRRTWQRLATSLRLGALQRCKKTSTTVKIDSLTNRRTLAASFRKTYIRETMYVVAQSMSYCSQSCDHRARPHLLHPQYARASGRAAWALT